MFLQRINNISNKIINHKMRKQIKKRFHHYFGPFFLVTFFFNLHKVEKKRGRNPWASAMANAPWPEIRYQSMEYFGPWAFLSQSPLTRGPHTTVAANHHSQEPLRDLAVHSSHPSRLRLPSPSPHAASRKRRNRERGGRRCRRRRRSSAPSWASAPRCTPTPSASSPTCAVRSIRNPPPLLLSSPLSLSLSLDLSSRRVLPFCTCCWLLIPSDLYLFLPETRVSWSGWGAPSLRVFLGVLDVMRFLTFLGFVSSTMLVIF